MVLPPFPPRVRRSSGNPRRIILPALIVLVAIILVIWAPRREARRLDDISQRITELCDAVAHDPDLTSRLPVADPLLARRLAPMLHSLCEPLRDNPRALEVTAASGDAPGFADDAAAYHAVIRIGGVHRLTLRLAYEDDRLLIIGYALPTATLPSTG